MTRNWSPCRVCGAEHTNPASSSICTSCGLKEREAQAEADQAAQQEYEESPFGQFMDLTEDERWRMVFDLIVAGRR